MTNDSSTDNLEDALESLFSSNTFAVRKAALNLGIPSMEEFVFPQPGEAPTSDFVRACKAAYEIR